MALIHIPLILVVAGGAPIGVPKPDYGPSRAAIAGSVIAADTTSEWWCKTFCPGPVCPKDCPLPKRGGNGDGPGHGERKMRTSDGPAKFEPHNAKKTDKESATDK